MHGTRERNCYIQRDGKFLTYTRNGEQKATAGIVKSTLKIPPRCNGVVPIRIAGQTMKNIWLTLLLMRLQREEILT